MNALFDIKITDSLSKAVYEIKINEKGYLGILPALL